MTDEKNDNLANLRKTHEEMYNLKKIKNEYQLHLDKNFIPKEFMLKLKLRHDASEKDRLNIEEKSNSASRGLMQENINVCDERILNLHLLIEGQSETPRTKLGEERYTTVFTSNKDDVHASITRNSLKNYKRSYSTKDIMTQDKSSNGSISTHTNESNSNKCASKEVWIDRDGHCFFRCFELHLCKGKKELDHAAIRKQIAEELISNIEFYEQYVDGDFQTHMNNLKLLNGCVASWATEAEIFAAENLFKVDIFVDNGEPDWLRFSLDNYKYSECNHSKKFICLKLRSNHFTLIKREQRPCKCT